MVTEKNGKKMYTKLVAQNLYNFMMSYNHQDQLINGVKGEEFLVVPQNFLVKWLGKFDQKYAKDPNFILKTTIN